MAQIRLDDDVYDRLKEAAERDCRTVGEEIHFLLDHRIELTTLAELLQSGPKQSSQQSPQKNFGDFASEKNIKSENPAGSADIQQLLIKRSRVIRDLDERNIMAWVQKRASEEFWTDEQAQIEMKKYREKLEQERDALDAQLHELGV